MSSKSKSSKSKKPARGAAAHAAAKPAGEPTHAAHGDEHGLEEKVEEVLHVPTGGSPWRFLLVVAMVILLTAIFAINPGTALRATSGGSGPELTWVHPERGVIEVSPVDFTLTKRGLTHIGQDPTDESTASFLVLDVLARDAGVHVTDAELADQLRQIAASPRFQDVAVLKRYMAGAPGGIRGFEEYLRSQMRVGRYMQLLAFLISEPEPEAIEAAWKEDHQEVAFDYVALEVASLLDEARAEVPDDAALEAWLAELDELDRQEFEEPERMRAELVGFLFDGGADAAGLLERYPDPGHADEGEDAPEGEGEEAAEDDHDDHDHGAELARSYFDRVLYWRFARPVAEDEEPAADFQSRFFDFEEVEEQAEREAPIYFALERWLADLRSRREAGEEIDLEAEATALGLDYRPAGDPLSTEEWTEVEGWGGATLGARLARLADGELAPVLMVEEGVVAVGRLVEKTEAYLPEFASIRDRVAEGWAEERARELAVERLVALRDGFEPLPEDADADEGDAEDEESEPLPHATEEAFAAAAEAAGLEVERRPFMERATSYNADPDADLPGHTYIRFQSELYDLEEGELSEPGLDANQERAFLVRSAGSRPAELWKMTPPEHEQAVRRAGFETYADFIEQNLAFEVLAERYQIEFPRRVPQDEG